MLCVRSMQCDFAAKTCSTGYRPPASARWTNVATGGHGRAGRAGRAGQGSSLSLSLSLSFSPSHRWVVRQLVN